MHFEYTKTDWSYGSLHIPTLPVCINGFPMGHLLVDTGAAATLLPLELADVLGIDLDPKNQIQFTGAGGKELCGIPSATKVEYLLEKGGFRPLIWKGTAFFVKNLPTPLLGQYQCLSALKVTLDGPKRLITIEGERK